VQTVKDGNTDFAAIDKAIANAKAHTDKPSLIVIKTTLGYGSPTRPASRARTAARSPRRGRGHKKALGWDPRRILHSRRGAQALPRGGDERPGGEGAWQERFDAYAKQFPELAEEWRRRIAGELPKGFDWDAVLPAFKNEAAETRTTAGKVLNALAQKLPSSSAAMPTSALDKTPLKEPGSFDSKTARAQPAFGVREHRDGEPLPTDRRTHVVPRRIYDSTCGNGCSPDAEPPSASCTGTHTRWPLR